MARKRWQAGSLQQIGRRRKCWQLRYREDVVRDGRRVRVLRKVILGTLKAYPTKRLAKRAATKWLEKINGINYRPVTEGTFALFAEKWMRDVLSQHKYSTQVTERSRIKNYLLPFFGEIQVKDLGPEMVQQFVAGIGLGPKSTRNCIATLRIMWNSAKNWRWTTIDWFEGLTLPEYMRPEAPHFTLEEMRQIINAANEPHKTFYRLAAETGMRLGELCALRVSALVLDAGIVIVRYSTWHGRLSSTKSKHARMFHLSPQLVERLKQQIATVAGNPDAFVFRTKNGTPWIGDDVVKDNLKPLLLELGIKQGVRIGMHAFRHGNASLMDKERVPLKIRQDRLGHVDAEEMTLGRYTHAESQDHAAAAEKLGELLEPNDDHNLAQMKPVNGRTM